MHTQYAENQAFNSTNPEGVESQFTFQISVTVSGTNESDAAVHLVDQMDKMVVFDELMVSYTHPGSSIEAFNEDSASDVSSTVFQSIVNDLRQMYRDSTTQGMEDGFAIVDSNMLASLYNRAASIQ